MIPKKDEAASAISNDDLDVNVEQKIIGKSN